jgi:hypothetical protein
LGCSPPALADSGATALPNPRAPPYGTHLVIYPRALARGRKNWGFQPWETDFSTEWRGGKGACREGGQGVWGSTWGGLEGGFRDSERREEKGERLEGCRSSAAGSSRRGEELAFAARASESQPAQSGACVRTPAADGLSRALTDACCRVHARHSLFAILRADSGLASSRSCCGTASGPGCAVPSTWCPPHPPRWESVGTILAREEFLT